MKKGFKVGSLKLYISIMKTMKAILDDEILKVADNE